MHKSFTLIEMLIVIVIIGILAAALVPRLISVQSRARNTQRKVAVTQIANGVKIYLNDNSNAYPTSFGTLVTSNILTSIPKDPQVTTNEPCRSPYHGTWAANYQSSGFYDFNLNYVYNGYMYIYTTRNKGLVLARMENEGGSANNSYLLGAVCSWGSIPWTTTGQDAYMDAYYTTELPAAPNMQGAMRAMTLGY